MPINLNNLQSVCDYIDKGASRIRMVVLRSLSYVGETCVGVARQRHTYKDQTGNLTSSIGYVLVEDGKILEMSDFGVVNQGEEGQADGRDFARQLATKYTKGIALILVAGRNYAAHVANRKYDVIDSAWLEADRLIPIMLKQINVTDYAKNF